MGVWGLPGTPQANAQLLDQLNYPSLDRAARPGGVDRVTAEHNVGRLVRGDPAAAIPLFEWYAFDVHLMVLEQFGRARVRHSIDEAIQHEFVAFRELLMGAQAAQQIRLAQRRTAIRRRPASCRPQAAGAVQKSAEASGAVPPNTPGDGKSGERRRSSRGPESGSPLLPPHRPAQTAGPPRSSNTWRRLERRRPKRRSLPLHPLPPPPHPPRSQRSVNGQPAELPTPGTEVGMTPGGADQGVRRRSAQPKEAVNFKDAGKSFLAGLADGGAANAPAEQTTAEAITASVRAAQGAPGAAAAAGAPAAGEAAAEAEDELPAEGEIAYDSVAGRWRDHEGKFVNAAPPTPEELAAIATETAAAGAEGAAGGAPQPVKVTLPGIEERGEAELEIEVDDPALAARLEFLAKTGCAGRRSRNSGPRSMRSAPSSRRSTRRSPWIRSASRYSG
jgi:hypothetical protein